MKPAQIILLLVALVAGGMAFFLVTRGGKAPAPKQQVVTEVVQESKGQVLVAKSPIGVGQRLSAANLEWQDWPEGAMRPEYVTASAMPDAPAELTGAVARFEFFPGEPIREAKLVRSDQGYLSAVLAPGMRGVSVGVSAVSSAGGFVVPNDHVDVLLSTSSAAGQQSEVILANVRVLAIGKRLGEMGTTGGDETGESASPKPTTFDNNTIATLELDPAQAETLVNASTRGQLSLTLRSVADFARTDTGPSSSTSQSVRLIRFGREQSVMTGTSSSANAVVNQQAAIDYSTDNAATALSPQTSDNVALPQVLPQ